MEHLVDSCRVGIMKGHQRTVEGSSPARLGMRGESGRWQRICQSFCYYVAGFLRATSYSCFVNGGDGSSNSLTHSSS